MITGLYAGILAICLAALLLNVVRLRFVLRVGLGDGDHPQLRQAMRIHGNFIEVVPFVLILMLIMEENGAQHFLLHLFGIALLVSRGAHFWGLSQSSGKSIGRMAGTIIAFSLMVVGGILVILHYMTGL